MSSKTMAIKVKCPSCDTLLTIENHLESPFVQCSVCRSLIQQSSSKSNTMPSIVEPHFTDDFVLSFDNDEIETSLKNSPYGPSNPAPRPTRLPAAARTEDVESESSGMGLGKFIFFILLVIYLTRLASSLSREPKPSTGTGHTYRVPSTEELRAHELIAESIRRRTAKEIEIELPRQPVEALPQNTIGVNVTGRNWSAKEINLIWNNRSIRKLIYRDVDIRAEDLKVIQKPGLTTIDLSDSRWPGKRFDNNFHLPQSLEHLTLAGSTCHGELLLNIDHCQSLVSLDLQDTPIDNSDLRGIFRHPSLEVLDLRNTEVTFDGLMKIVAPNLKTLFLSEGLLTAKDLDSLKRLLPATRIVIPEGPIPQLFR